MDTDDKTPVATAEGSRIQGGILDLLDELARLERDLRPLARAVDQFADPERADFLETLEERLRQVGELGHRSASVVWYIRHERRTRMG